MPSVFVGKYKCSSSMTDFSKDRKTFWLSDQQWLKTNWAADSHFCFSFASLLCCSQMHVRRSTSWLVSEEWQPQVWFLHPSARRWIWHRNKCCDVNRDRDWFLQVAVGGLQMISFLRDRCYSSAQSSQRNKLSHSQLRRNDHFILLQLVWRWRC